MTDLTEHTVQLRALMSADDSSKAWDLRCQVREELLNFIRSEMPEALPRRRVEVDQSVEKPTDSASPTT